jgi:hypothetical protein
LEGEESQDEKIEALEGILVEISTVKWLLSFFHRFHIPLSYDLFNKLSNAQCRQMAWLKMRSVKKS